MLFTFKNKETKIITRIDHSRNFCVCLTHGLHLQKIKSQWAIQIKNCHPSQVQWAHWFQTLLVSLTKHNKSQVRERIASKSHLNFILNEARDLEMGITFKCKDASYRSPWRNTEALGLKAKTSTTRVKEQAIFARLLPGVKNNNYGELFKQSQ